MGFFFPENCDQSVEVSAEINGSLIFGILGLFSGGKIQHLTIYWKVACLYESRFIPVWEHLLWMVACGI